MSAAPAPTEKDYALLSEAERRRAAKFILEKDRRLFVAGRVMVRTILGRVLGIRGQDVQIRFGGHGRPELEGADSDLNFNLSHSGSYVAVAIASGRQVGVDIELQHPQPNMLALGREYFCPREIHRLETDQERAQELFFRYWTLKEAYCKAIGKGLSGGFPNLDVSSVGEETEPDDIRQEADVQMKILEAPVGYSAAIAGTGRPWKLSMKRWIPEH